MNPKLLQEIKIYYQNVRSVKNKVDDLKELLIDKQYDIICLVETWLTPDTLGTLSLANQLNWNYSLHLRENKKGGGTLILSQPHLKITREYISITNELVQVSLTEPFNLNLTLLYNPPGFPQNGWDMVIDDCINKSSTSAPLLILGDFNISNWTPAQGDPHLTPILEEHGLEQMIDFPTRGNNYLDLLLKRNIDVTNIRKLSIFDSDHMGFELSVNGPQTMQTNNVSHRVVRDYFRTNWTMMNHHIFELGESNEIELFSKEQIDKFIIKLFSLCESMIPTKKILANKIPWMDTELRSLLLKKNRLHKIWKIRMTQLSYDRFKEARCDFKQCNKKKTKDYLLRYQETYKSDPKSFWKTLMNGRKKPVNTIIDPQDFADYFSMLVREERDLNDHNIPTWHNRFTPIAEVNIDIGAVKDLCQSNSFTSKSSPDVINGSVLKNCASSLAPLLTRIYKRAAELGHYPEPLKKSSVFPLHKKGQKTDPKNYRQITIQPLIGKLFDKLMYNTIYSHVMPQISDQNHYCVKKRSVNTNLLSTLAYVSESFENAMQVDVIYADLAKAFDNVAHKYLILKLQHQFGIVGKLLELLQSYLHNRCYFVKINDSISNTYSASKGIPQGGILSPLLFTMFTNDLNIGDKCKLLTYADDVKIMKARPYKQHNRSELQDAIDKFHKWTIDWALTVNIDKTKLITFSQKKNKKETIDDQQILIDGACIQVVEEFKDLGVIFDSYLSFKAHTEKVNLKLRQALGYLNFKFGWVTSATARRMLYNACFTSQLEYGLTIWAAASPSNLQSIINTQKRAIRKFLFKSNISNGTDDISLYKKANMLSLNDRAIILALNVIKNDAPSDMKYFIPTKATLHRYDMRNPARYKVPAVKLTLTQRSWRFKLPNFLNSLPEEQYQAITNNSNWKFIIKSYMLTLY